MTYIWIVAVVFLIGNIAIHGVRDGIMATIFVAIMLGYGWALFALIG